MPPTFTYTAPESRYVGTLANLLARSGDPQAQAAVDAARASGQADIARGNAWAGAAHDIAAIPGQIAQAKNEAVRTSLLQSEVEQRKLQVQGQQRAQAGQALVGQLVKQHGDDYEAVAKGLTEAGFVDAASKYRKDAVDTLEDRQKIAGLKRQADAALASSIGKAAFGSTDADEFLGKLDHYVVGGQVSPEDRAKFVQSLQQAGPDGFDAWKKRTVDWADSVVAPTKVTKDEKLLKGVSGAPIVDNTVKPQPTRAGLAATANDPSKTPEERAAATAALASMTAPPKRTEAEQELDAYAKFINKPNAEALTYGDRQTFEKNKAAIRANTAFQQHVAERQYDNAHPAPEKPKNQDTIEQEYRAVLTRAMSSRSGGIGAEDAKVQQANHLTALIDQNYDPKTDSYNISRVQQTELAMGLAKLVAPGGTVGVQMEKEINQRTAKGDFGGAMTYILGTPFNGTTQDLVKMYKDSIERQGKVAETNREGEMAYLRGLAPTTLNEDRRKALEATSLNPLRQSRVIKNTQTGERKLQVSIDGGKTWQ